jgi:hypothetical protein
MQLILSGVLHIDVPPGNVPLQAVRALEQASIGGQRHSHQPGRQLSRLTASSAPRTTI